MRPDLPGIKAKHAIVTPLCRRNRGDQGAIDEALRRIREEFLACCTDANDSANFHVVLTVERLRI